MFWVVVVKEGGGNKRKKIQGNCLPPPLPWSVLIEWRLVHIRENIFLTKASWQHGVWVRKGKEKPTMQLMVLPMSTTQRNFFPTFHVCIYEVYTCNDLWFFSVWVLQNLHINLYILETTYFKPAFTSKDSCATATKTLLCHDARFGSQRRNVAELQKDRRIHVNKTKWSR